MLEPISKTIEVPCSQERAFTVFLEMGTWWPRDKFATSVMRGDGVQEIRVDAREGGAIVEVAKDGQEHPWGKINTYDPFGYLHLDFHVPHPTEENPGFTTVEVRFTELAADRTRVELTQSGWDAMGDMAEMVHGGYGQAWGMIFEGAFAEACAR